MAGTALRYLLVGGSAGAQTPAPAGPLSPDQIPFAPTVEQLRRICSADQPTTIVGGYSAGRCDGFISGAANMHAGTVILAKGAETRFCLDAAANVGMLRESFLVWAARNPRAADDPAMAGLISAWRESFPCR
jgi:hypothetical protein